MNPVSSVIPVPFPKNAKPFPVRYSSSTTNVDDILPVELYSPARSIVTAAVKGEGFRRLDVDFIALNGRCVPAYLLGHDSIECGVGVYEAVRLAWLTLYIPALDSGISPDKLEFGTFSVSTAE